MRTLLIIAAAALAVAGCSGGADTANEVDTLAVNNLVVDDGTAVNADMNAMMPSDMNAMTVNDLNAMNTQELQQKDLTTNDADTNLANGL